MGSNAYIYFPKTDTLKGSAENAEVKGKDAIAMLSVSHHVSMPLSAASVGGQARMAGRAVFGDITVTKYVDEVSPHLQHFCAGGNIVPTAILTWFSTGQKDATAVPINYLEITLSDVIISSISHSGSGGADNHTETFTLNFTKIQWKQMQMDNTSKGAAPASVTTTWDLFKNTK